MVGTIYYFTKFLDLSLAASSKYVMLSHNSFNTACDVLVVCCRSGLDTNQWVLRVLGTSTTALCSFRMLRHNEKRKFWHISQWNSR